MNKPFIITIFLFTVLFISCEKPQPDTKNTTNQELSEKERNNLINPQGKTIETRFLLPDGYKRENYPENSFAIYLRTFPLKPDTSRVIYYDGKIKNKKVHAAILDIDVGDKDLQQCADAVMRLRAEYLFKQKRFSDIHFNFTSKFSAEYTKWAEGYRIQMSGNNASWIKTQQPDYSYENFKKYIFFVYNYAGTLSLSQELKTKTYKDLDIGDVFIQGGSPGHAMIVMDVALNPKNQKKIYLLAQSYMPAQSIHVVKNLQNPRISPWYELNEKEEKVFTPEWTFKTTNLKTF